MITVKCQYCGKEFKTSKKRLDNGHGKFCSRICLYKSLSKKIKVKCYFCNKELIRNPSSSKNKVFCNVNCKNEYCKSLIGPLSFAWKGGKKILFCQICGKQFLINKSGTKRNRGKFCSRECYALFLKKEYSGENSWNWKGGLTPERNKIRKSIEYRLWRNSVLARDSFTCQKTGVKGGTLRAHHIQNFAQFPELRFAIDNGITLSKESHNEFHKLYGIKNNTKEQLEEFLNNEQNG